MPGRMAVYDGDKSERASPPLGGSGSRHPFLHHRHKGHEPRHLQAYTGKSNQQVIDNLVWLSTHAKHKDKIIIRLPLIPQFNTPEDRERSKQALKQMGFERFDEFEYICRH